MLGALFFIYLFCYGFYIFFKRLKETIRLMDQTYDAQSNTYMSYDGTLVDKGTGKIRFIHGDKHGDRWLIGPGIQPLNLSQQEREKEYLRLKENPGDKTVILYEREPENKTYGDGIKRGSRYKDLHTGDLYVERHLKRGDDFYVRISDDKVIRFTDRHKERLLEWGMYTKEGEIAAINEFQKEIDEAKKDKYFWNDDPTLIGCYYARSVL